MDFKPTKRTLLFMAAMGLSFIVIYTLVTFLTSLF